MNAALFALCIIPIVLVLPPWGVSSLMVAIGKIRGWNTKYTFWATFIICILLMTGLFLIVWIYGDSLLSTGGFGTFVFTTLIITPIVIGIILAPLANLVLKSRYPDVFKKPTPSRASPVSNAQAVIEKEPLPQKQLPVSSSKDSQTQPELVSAPPLIKPNDTVSSGHIFISYRRSDSADIAGRIYDRLIGKFERKLVFKDVDSIPLGLDFKEYLDQKVGECDVLLAIIGDHWLDASSTSGNKRLEDPHDFVRIEIESALQRGIPVIPLLVRGAQMPAEESLPTSLRKLVYRNGIPIRSDPDFHRDMDRLINALEKYAQ